MAGSPARSAVGVAGGALAVGLLAALVARPAATMNAQAVLKTARGETLGTVTFVVDPNLNLTRVAAKLTFPAGVDPNTFHGFHIHANDKPENGVGCVADPNKPANTWFTSADGHLSAMGQNHGAHNGDMPSILINPGGTAEITFTTGKLNFNDLNNRVVILHTGADNFGNVPTGTAADQYTPNSPDAVTKTNGTGNAGDRLACGVIQVTSGAPATTS